MTKGKYNLDEMTQQLLGQEQITGEFDERYEDDQPDYYKADYTDTPSSEDYLHRPIYEDEEDYDESDVFDDYDENGSNGGNDNNYGDDSYVFDYSEKNGNNGHSWIDVAIKIALLFLVLMIIITFVSCHHNGWRFFVPPSENESETSTETESESEFESEAEVETETSAISEAESTEESAEDVTQETSADSENATSKPSKQPTTVVPSKTQKPIKVTATIKNITRVYGDEFIALDYEISAGNVTKAELSKYITLTKDPGNEVGQYWINGTCNAPEKFDVTFIKGIYTITLRDVTVQAENKESYVGEKLKDLTYTVSKGSIVKGDKVAELSTKADASKAGTYDIVGKCINSNYNLTVKVGKYTVKAKDSSSSSSETKPIDVTIKISDKSSYYGDTIVALDFSITKGNVKKSDLSKYITLTKASGNNVGNYKITGKCKDTKKYNVTFTNGTYTIKPRKLSIKVDNKESFAGDSLEKLTYSVTSGSVVAGDDVIELSTNADPAKAGTYDIIAKNKNSNYDVTIANKGVYIVKEKPAKDVTIQIESKTRTYGDSTVGFDFSIVGGNVTKAEITPYITLSKEGDNNVGIHKITGTCSDTKKYNVTFIEGTYTITQRSISVKADNKLTYEGDPLADLTYTLNSGSIVDGDDVISLSTAATPSAIGEHTIVVECKNSNYALQSENGTYRVKAKPNIPQDEEEEEGSTESSGPKDDEEDVVPSKPTPTTPILTDEDEEVQPTTSTP